MTGISSFSQIALLNNSTHLSIMQLSYCALMAWTLAMNKRKNSVNISLARNVDQYFLYTIILIFNLGFRVDTSTTSGRCCGSVSNGITAVDRLAIFMDCPIPLTKNQKLRASIRLSVSMWWIQFDQLPYIPGNMLSRWWWTLSSNCDPK